jgi:hypothetical protein
MSGGGQGGIDDNSVQDAVDELVETEVERSIDCTNTSNSGRRWRLSDSGDEHLLSHAADAVVPLPIELSGSTASSVLSRRTPPVMMSADHSRQSSQQTIASSATSHGSVN